ncbi:MAG: hypothetical protein IH612_10250 [Desulfofustis sp.]|nr:hypothetical protein [Desulfofustis sp.]
MMQRQCRGKAEDIKTIAEIDPGGDRACCRPSSDEIKFEELVDEMGTAVTAPSQVNKPAPSHRRAAQFIV